MRNSIKILTCVMMAFLFLGNQTLHAEAKRALLVGISDYGNHDEDPNKWANISGANDIKLLAPLFEAQGFKVTSLVDAQATHAGITGTLDKLAKDSKKGDIVYIHFSPLMRRCYTLPVYMKERTIFLTMSWKHISTTYAIK